MNKGLTIAAASMMLLVSMMAIVPTASAGYTGIVFIPESQTPLYSVVPGGPEISLETGFLTVTVDPEELGITSDGDPISVGVIAVLPEGTIDIFRHLMVVNVLESIGVGLDWEVQNSESYSTVCTGEEAIGQLVYGQVEVWAAGYKIASAPACWVDEIVHITSLEDQS
ncbi:MAG: hypothetical protein CVT48_03460 [Thermoplasmata archaeon HGW-Thermoplasmata-1]|nr:MAG: hypothetical protein CVT48_03460 [Thermoplasmata archaeon HGW-Thermoplasmata-1]